MLIFFWVLVPCRLIWRSGVKAPRNLKGMYGILNNEFESDSKKKNVRDFYRNINKFKEVYQPDINLVKEENGDLLRFTQYFK